MHQAQKAQTLSIIIPAYNEQIHIETCLQMIAAQAEMPDEVIVVDNNSSDDTRAIAEQFPFVTIISEQRQGSMFASHAGMNQASGDIIGRIDADSRLAADWVEMVKRSFQKNSEIAALTGRCTFRDVAFAIPFSSLHGFFYYSLQKMIAGTEILWGSNMAIRRSAWEVVKQDCHLRPGIDEDIDIALCLHKKDLLIRRSDDMRAAVAVKVQTKNSPRKVYKYLSTWPRDYFVNGYKGRGSIIWMLMLACVIATVPVSTFYWLLSKIQSQ